MFELLAFEEMIHSISLPANAADIAAGNATASNTTDVKEYKLFDICRLYNITDEATQDELEDEDEDYVRVGPKCYTSAKPQDFIYELDGDLYNMTAYEDDKELLSKI